MRLLKPKVAFLLLSLFIFNCVGFSFSNLKTAKALGKEEAQVLVGFESMDGGGIIEAMGRAPVVPNYLDVGFKLNYLYVLVGFEIDVKYQFLHLENFSSAFDLSVQNLPILLFTYFQKTLSELIFVTPSWLYTYQMADWLSFTSGIKAQFFLQNWPEPLLGIPLTFDIGGKNFGAILESTCFTDRKFSGVMFDFAIAFRYNMTSDE